jgi:hypothetical protein
MDEIKAILPITILFIFVGLLLGVGLIVFDAFGTASKATTIGFDTNKDFTTNSATMAGTFCSAVNQVDNGTYTAQPGISNLTNYYPFDIDTNDYSGNSENGIGANLSAVVGKYSQAYYFNGADSFVNISHNAKQLLVGGGTITAWIYPTGYGESGRGVIVQKATQSTAVGGYNFAFDAGTHLTGVLNATTLSGSGVIPLNTWTFVAFTFNASGFGYIYINGVLDNSGQITDPTEITTTGNLMIGNRAYGTDRTFNGTIDSVRIYNIGLTAAQINTIFATGYATQTWDLTTYNITLSAKDTCVVHANLPTTSTYNVTYQYKGTTATSAAMTNMASAASSISTNWMALIITVVMLGIVLYITFGIFGSSRK